MLRHFWWSSGTFDFSVSTILLSNRTAEGIVLASDGKESSPLTGENLSVQKIFPISRSIGPCLAYGIAGATKLGNASQIAFDFLSEVAQKTARLAENYPGEWWSYVTQLTDALNDSIEQKRRRMVNPEETYVLLAGTYGGHFETAHITFRHWFDKTEATPVPHGPGVNAEFGSPTIFKLIGQPLSHFAQYAEPRRETVRTVQQAIERALADIHAHCDPEAPREDAMCSTIGGRIQIATITFSEGFRWLPGYEPVI